MYTFEKPLVVWINLNLVSPPTVPETWDPCELPRQTAGRNIEVPSCGAGLSSYVLESPVLLYARRLWTANFPMSMQRICTACFAPPLLWGRSCAGWQMVYRRGWSDLEVTLGLRHPLGLSCPHGLDLRGLTLGERGPRPRVPWLPVAARCHPAAGLWRQPARAHREPRREQRGRGKRERACIETRGQRWQQPIFITEPKYFQWFLCINAV